jgi:hypothetical protein
MPSIVKPSSATQNSPVLELEEFPSAVGGLSERHDARVADERAKRLEIVVALPRFHGGKRDRRRSDPFDDGLIRMPDGHDHEFQSA